MKKFIYLCLFQFLFIHFTQAQCFQPDASVWKDNWASCAKSQNPNGEYGNSHWIQYNFGSVRNLSKTWVWNTNEPSQLDQGFNQVAIDYSEDGQTWTHWGEMTFPKAEGETIYSGFAGPDLQNIKAQYVLLTAISNHGHATCAGLTEIKFNLMPSNEGQIPTNNEEEDDEETEDDDEMEEDICTLLEEVNLNEIIEIEVEFTEAFIFLEVEEELLEEFEFLFEYRAVGGEWLSLPIEEAELFLEELMPGTSYEYRISLACEDEESVSPSQTFQTLTCGTIDEIVVEELTATEAFFLWTNTANMEFFLIEVNDGEEIWDWEVEEAELFLDELAPNTNYELRVGIECGETIVWSEWIAFQTTGEDEEDLNLSTSVNTRLNLSNQQVHLFPNPTPGNLTIRLKTEIKDVLNFSVTDANGRILFRNVAQLYSGTNDLKLDVSSLPDGTYWLQGVTLNQRANISQQIVKVSR